MHYATGGRVAYTMDSLTYRDAALNFISGHPMQSTNVNTQEPERKPLLVWPPAYPALWASTTSLNNINIDETPSLLNPVLLVLTTLSIFWIGWLITGKPTIACLMATINAFTPTSMIVFGHAWSETLFIPLLLLAYAFVWKYIISRDKFIWLAAAAVFIGASNWVRYAGVAFLPILGISVLAVSGNGVRKRVLHALSAMLLGVILALPLWIHNWKLVGNISGSSRGGVSRADRLFEDVRTIIDLFEHSFFAFSMVLRANLEIPIILIVVFILFRKFRHHGMTWLSLPTVRLPIIWLSGYFLFLLYARTIQSEVPMDLRMLAVAFPFLLLILTPAVNSAFSDHAPNVWKILITLLLGLLIYSGFNEAHRTHENYVTAGVPRWRSVFGLGFRDLRNTSPSSLALQESIRPVPPSTLILTDYRALYIRYLTGAQAFSPFPASDCTGWKSESADTLLLIGSSVLPPWAIQCLEKHPHWRLLRPSGRAAPSIYAD